MGETIALGSQDVVSKVQELTEHGQKIGEVDSVYYFTSFLRTCYSCIFTSSPWQESRTWFVV